MSGTLFQATSGPGAYLRETDASQQTNGAATDVGVIVGGSLRGPTVPVLVTSGSQAQSIFGPGDTSISLFQASAFPFLLKANNLWMLRVINDGIEQSGSDYTLTYSDAQTYSYLQVANDVIGPDGVQTRLFAGQGWPTDYETGPESGNFVLPLNLVNGDNVTIYITDGTLSANIGPISYADGNDATLAALASAIQNAVNEVWDTNQVLPATASVLTYPTVNTAVAIRVVPPLLFNTSQGTYEPVVFTSASDGIITHSDSSTAPIAWENTGLIDVFAQNPGSWGNNYGITLTDTSYGQQQRMTLTLSTALISGNTFTCTITVNGQSVPVGPVTFATTAPAMMTSIASAIETTLNNTFGGQGFAEVVPVNGVITNSLVLLVVSPFDGPNTMSISNVSITGGASQPLVSIATTVTGIAGADTFLFSVFNNSNPNVAVESFTVSFNHQLNGFNNQQFIETVINSTFANGAVGAGTSLNVSVRYCGADFNPAGRLINPTSSITYMAGGADGSLVNDSDVVLGWKTFLDAETYPSIDLLINGGYTDTAVAQQIASVASTRMDCFAVLDMPSSEQAAADAVAYVNDTLNIGTSYASIYTPDLYVLDTNSNTEVYVSPSGYVAAQFAMTDQQYGIQFAAAGVMRGAIPNVLGLRYYYDGGDRYDLDSNNICAIRRINGVYSIFGVQTLNPVSSLLSFNSVRRLFTFLETSILKSLIAYNFDLINPQTEFLVTQNITAFLQPYKDAQAIQNFMVLCNSTNNTPATADVGQMNVTVYVIPYAPAKVIVLDAVVTPSSVSFQELIANGIM